MVTQRDNHVPRKDNPAAKALIALVMLLVATLARGADLETTIRSQGLADYVESLFDDGSILKEMAPPLQKLAAIKSLNAIRSFKMRRITAGAIHPNSFQEFQFIVGEFDEGPILAVLGLAHRTNKLSLMSIDVNGFAKEDGQEIVNRWFPLLDDFKPKRELIKATTDSLNAELKAKDVTRFVSFTETLRARAHPPKHLDHLFGGGSAEDNAKDNAMFEKTRFEDHVSYVKSKSLTPVSFCSLFRCQSSAGPAAIMVTFLLWEDNPLVAGVWYGGGTQTYPLAGELENKRPSENAHIDN